MSFEFDSYAWLLFLTVATATLAAFTVWRNRRIQRISSMPRAVYHSFMLHRRQWTTIVISLAIPWLANVLYQSGMTALNLTPLAVMLTVLLLVWSTLHVSSANTLPTAHTAVFQNLSDAIFILDSQNCIINLNPAAELLIQLPPETLLGLPIQTAFRHWPALLEQIENAPTVHTEISLEDASEPVYYDLSILAVYDLRQQLISRVIVIRNITIHKQTELAEREQRILAEALRDAAAALNNTLDLDEVLDRILSDVGRVLPHDTANVMLLRGDVAHFVGYRGYTGMLDLVHKVWPLEKTPNLQQMAQTGRPIVISDVTQNPGWVDTPATRWIRSYVGAPIQRKGEVLGFINLDSATPGLYQQKHGERLQAFANQAAIALGNARLFAELAERNAELDAYARTIAHDLKSPLGLINGYAELVAEYDLPPMGQAHLDIIRVTIGRMEEMIEQLLLLAQLRDVTQTAVSVPVLPLIYAAIARFTDQIEAHKIVIQVDKNLPPLSGHAPWLEEIFANLIGNAIKYIGSDNSEPFIHIRAVAEGSMVRYTISDNGLGISLADQDKLFDMFTRFHRQEASGTGLGLPIVQRIVRKLGGDVGVDSQPGGGSTFWFTLPAG
ncbi:MAG: GAF domain-containing protein [Chloroflexi bacterium]|nr:GAF domain-containing protein [Chloroflexota bacterium]